MTLADELAGIIPKVSTVKARQVVGGALRLPFNGELSADEQRMLEQFAFEEFSEQ